jgi:hypothetical protein
VQCECELILFDDFQKKRAAYWCGRTMLQIQELCCNDIMHTSACSNCHNQASAFLLFVMSENKYLCILEWYHEQPVASSKQCIMA